MASTQDAFSSCVAVGPRHMNDARKTSRRRRISSSASAASGPAAAVPAKRWGRQGMPPPPRQKGQDRGSQTLRVAASISLVFTRRLMRRQRFS